MQGFLAAVVLLSAVALAQDFSSGAPPPPTGMSIDQLLGDIFSISYLEQYTAAENATIQAAIDALFSPVALATTQQNTTVAAFLDSLFGNGQPLQGVADPHAFSAQIEGLFVLVKPLSNDFPALAKHLSIIMSGLFSLQQTYSTEGVMPQSAAGAFQFTTSALATAILQYSPQTAEDALTVLISAFVSAVSAADVSSNLAASAYLGVYTVAALLNPINPQDYQVSSLVTQSQYATSLAVQFANATDERSFIILQSAFQALIVPVGVCASFSSYSGPLISHGLDGAFLSAIQKWAASTASQFYGAVDEENFPEDVFIATAVALSAQQSPAALISFEHQTSIILHGIKSQLVRDQASILFAAQIPLYMSFISLLGAASAGPNANVYDQALGTSNLAFVQVSSTSILFPDFASAVAFENLIKVTPVGPPTDASNTEDYTVSRSAALIEWTEKVSSGGSVASSTTGSVSTVGVVLIVVGLLVCVLAAALFTANYKKKRASGVVYASDSARSSRSSLQSQTSTAKLIRVRTASA